MAGSRGYSVCACEANGAHQVTESHKRNDVEERILINCFQSKYCRWIKLTPSLRYAWASNWHPIHCTYCSLIVSMRVRVRLHCWAIVVATSFSLQGRPNYTFLLTLSCAFASLSCHLTLSLYSRTVEPRANQFPHAWFYVCFFSSIRICSHFHDIKKYAKSVDQRVAKLLFCVSERLRRSSQHEQTHTNITPTFFPLLTNASFNWDARREVVID